jgi:RNAse (barnase) inhibitor barstar
MTDNRSIFSFEPSKIEIDPEADFIMQVPAGVTKKDELLEAFRRGLSLPDYFGYNWDSLDECLRDLAWIKRRRVIIIHQDLPQLDAKQLEAYLEVLADSARDWKPGEDHELIVAFPEELQEAITTILAHYRGLLAG